MASSKTRLVISWTLSLLPALMMLGPSAFLKLNPSAEMAADFINMGLTAQQVFAIGVVEIVIVLLYLVPRTSFIGAILVTGYLGGATFVNLRAGEPFFLPIAFGLIIWVALGLRRPEIFRLTFASGTELETRSSG
ncbi:MAG: DoxX family protein [Planctomycetota bacterium]